MSQLTKFLTVATLLPVSLLASPAITDSFLQTSYREGRVDLHLSGTAPAGGEVTVAAALQEAADSTTPVRSFEPETVNANSDGQWSATLTMPLDGLKLWSRQFPNLYYYTATATSGGETASLEPRRVGLREVWIEDGGFVLNGNPLVIVDDVWVRAIPRDSHENIVLAMRQAKAMGFSGLRSSNPAHIAAADEVGIAVITNVGSFVRINIWDPASGLTRMDGDENREQVADRIRALREHPSIIAWSSNAPYSLAAMHPEYTGQYFNTWEHFPLNRFEGPPEEGQKIFRELARLAAEIDPTRAVASHNGPFSPIQVSTLYLCDNLDRQEREEFFHHWYHSGPDRKVVWPSEVGTPFAGHQFIRYIDHQMPQGGLWPKIHLENLARIQGDSAYQMEEDENFSQWLRQNFYPMMKWPAVQAITAYNVEPLWRTYRTYGVNFSAHHVLNENCFGPIPDTVDGEPRRGLTRAFPNAEVDEITPAARVYLDAVKPLMGYIGGPDGDFANKDHLYFANAEVNKAFIVVNDLDEAATINGQWQLLDAAGKAVASGTLSGSVAPGSRAITDFPITFPAPAVAERTDFTLRVSSSAPGDHAKLDDEFQITVFPPHKRPDVSFPGTIWTLNISDDLTHESPHFFINRDNAAFLEAAGVDARLLAGMRTFEWHGYSPDAAHTLLGPVKRKDKDDLPARELITEGSPAPGDLLIIPRHALTSGQGDRELALRTLEHLQIDDLIAEGLRVIVLEQPLPNIFGINTETTRPRRAFISAKGHPIFEGLADSDLSNWTGSSNLEQAITPYSSSDQRWPERVWNTSNTNTVASRPLVRPQVGATRALAVSGFDLQESPLLEVTRGKGRMIFCQFDVTNRYGKDPAATRLVDNLFAYITSVAEPDPSRGEVAVAAEGSPGVIMKQVFRAAVPAGEEGWGITQGDLFFRESIYDRNQITRTLPDRTFPVFEGEGAHGYPPVVRRTANNLLETTITPSIFETGWMKRKAAWVDSALAINQGGSRTDGPQFALQGRQTPLYPHVWVEGFVHPYTSNIW